MSLVDKMKRKAQRTEEQIRQKEQSRLERLKSREAKEAARSEIAEARLRRKINYERQLAEYRELERRRKRAEVDIRGMGGGSIFGRLFPPPPKAKAKAKPRKSTTLAKKRKKAKAKRSPGRTVILRL